MDTLDKRIARCLLTKTLTFIIVSLILFLFQLMLAGRDVAFQQAPMLVVISTIFLALNFVSGMAHDWVMKDGAKRALSFYLVVKVVRFFLVAAILLIYGLADRRNILAFAINLLVLYIANVVTSMMYYIKMEQNIKKKQ